MSERIVITISREYGSGGKEISQKLAAKLGISAYGDEIPSMAAEENGIQKSYFEKADEHPTDSFLYMLAMNTLAVKNSMNPYENALSNDKLFNKQAEVIRELAEKYNGGKPLNVVANLPYYITTPIIMSLLEDGAPVKSITVMIQKEVAERMQAGPGGKEYGALSLAVQYYCDTEIVANVPPNCFIPRPNVGSCVIRLNRYAEPPVRVKDPEKMFKIIRAAFNQRRKTLANAVSHGGISGGNAGAEGNSAGTSGGTVGRERVTEVLREMGLSETIRGEAMTLDQFAEFSDRL